MQRIAAGDESAVGELYDRFGALVFQSARQVLNSRAEADDAVQEVFVRLWKTADRFDPGRAKLVTWVMLICRRHLIDRLRRRGARPDMGAGEGPALDQSPAAGGREELEDEERQRIRDRISELPDLQREVIERAYLQGFTLREVALQLDAPLGTVKSALSRGLARLRERLAETDLPGAPGASREDA
jgi:RNA polymerase sigma factor (sigma-70 family)